MHGRKTNAKGRSTTEYLSRLKKVNSPPKNDSWGWLVQEHVESHAYQALKINERRIFDRIWLEHMHHAGSENGNLICTYDDFETFGVSRKYIRPALNTLHHFGLIRYKPGKPNGRHRPPWIFRLTWMPTMDGIPATNEWKGITTETIQDWREKERNRHKAKAEKKKNSPVPEEEPNIVVKQEPNSTYH